VPASKASGPSDARSLVGLDIGAQRVGVAIASLVARLPRPLITLQQGDDFMPSLERIITEEAVGALVIGWPRGLDGQTTTQTKLTEAFSRQLKEHFQLPIYMQDEALTSKKAERELQARGKAYARSEVDALAATYILEDFLAEHPEGLV